MSAGNINNKLKFRINTLSNTFTFLLSEEGVADRLCAPIFSRKKQWKVAHYTNFP